LDNIFWLIQVWGPAKIIKAVPRQGNNAHQPGNALSFVKRIIPATIYMKILRTYCFLWHYSFICKKSAWILIFIFVVSIKEPTIRCAQLTGHVSSHALGFSS